MVAGTEQIPCSPRKNNVLARGRKNMCGTPSFSSGGPNGPIERPNRTGTNKVFFDGDGYHRSWRWTLIAHQNTQLCRGMCKRLSLVLIWLARAKFLDGPKLLFFFPRNGTNGHERPRSVPSHPVPQGRTEVRHGLRIRPQQKHHQPLGFARASSNLIVHANMEPLLS